MGALEDALARAKAQVEHREYFEAHDTLEAVWRTAQGDVKIALQGLVQICAGLHKYSRGEASGAQYLLSRGLSKIQRCGGALPLGATDPFERAALGPFAELREGA